MEHCQHTVIFATLALYFWGSILHMMLPQHWIRGSNCWPCSSGVAAYVTHNGRLTGSRVWSIEFCHFHFFTDLEVSLTQIFKAHRNANLFLNLIDNFDKFDLWLWIFFLDFTWSFVWTLFRHVGPTFQQAVSEHHHIINIRLLIIK